MSTPLLRVGKVWTLLVIGTVVAAAPLEAQEEAASTVFVPPGMPVLEHPGTVRVLPGMQIERSYGSQFTLERRQGIITARQRSKQRGWVEITESKAGRVDAYFDRPEFRNRFRELHAISNTLTVVPAAVQGTPLGEAITLGASPSGVFAKGGWTGVTRAFTAPRLGRVILEEFDYAAAGTQIAVPEESIDSYMNGMPVVIDAYRAPSGKGYTEFVWFTEQKQFTLVVGKYLSKSDKARDVIRNLMALLY